MMATITAFYTQKKICIIIKVTLLLHIEYLQMLTSGFIKSQLPSQMMDIIILDMKERLHGRDGGMFTITICHQPQEYT